jgi:hypothetical protein
MTFYPNICHKLSKIWGFGIRDPRSGIRKKPIPDQKGTGSRVKKAPDPRSGLATLLFQKTEMILYRDTEQDKRPESRDEKKKER